MNDAILRLGDKWTMIIVLQLRGGALRAGALKRLLPGVSQRMLTLSLRTLERDGLVRRTLTPSVPPQVDYELTALGHTLTAPLDALGAWAIQNADQVREARRDFDDRTKLR